MVELIGDGVVDSAIVTSNDSCQMDDVRLVKTIPIVLEDVTCSKVGKMDRCKDALTA